MSFDFSLYLENLPLVVVKDLLFQAVVTDGLHAHEPENLDEGILLGNAVFNVRVHLGYKTSKILKIYPIHNFSKLSNLFLTANLH